MWTILVFVRIPRYMNCIRTNTQMDLNINLCSALVNGCVSKAMSFGIIPTQMFQTFVVIFQSLALYLFSACHQVRQFKFKMIPWWRCNQSQILMLKPGSGHSDFGDNAMLVTPQCSWRCYFVDFQCIKLVTNISNRSSTFQNCHQHISYPKSAPTSM